MLKKGVFTLDNPNLVQSIADFFYESVGKKFSYRMTTYVNEEVRLRERTLGYLKKIKLKNNSVLILGFTTEMNQDLILPLSEDSKKFGSIKVSVISSKDGKGRQTETIDFSEPFILTAEINIKGVAIYQTNAKFNKSGIVEVRWIHKIEFVPMNE